MRVASPRRGIERYNDGTRFEQGSFWYARKQRHPKRTYSAEQKENWKGKRFQLTVRHDSHSRRAILDHFGDVFLVLSLD